MIRLPPDFLDLLTALNAAEAKYLLVGGHAVGFHGVPRGDAAGLRREPTTD